VAGVVAAVPASAAPAKPSREQKVAARTWYRHVISDLSPLNSSLVSGLQAASQWKSGQESATAAGQTIAGDLSDLRTALSNLQHQKPLKGEAGALADFADSVNLYLQAFLLEETATTLSSGPLGAQLQRSFERIRQLGDVTYDVGASELVQLLGTALVGSDVQAVRHLPDWTSSELVPGPPLASSWVVGHSEPTGAQSRSDWAVAVRRAGAPSQSAVRSDVQKRATAIAQLSNVARALQQAEAHLDSVPGPRGNPLDSATYRLGLLVDTEAVLAAQASQLASVPRNAALGKVALSLSTIGAGLRHSASSPNG
jgi:hypothetical protein